MSYLLQICDALKLADIYVERSEDGVLKLGLLNPCFVIRVCMPYMPLYEDPTGIAITVSMAWIQWNFEEVQL